MRPAHGRAISAAILLLSLEMNIVTADSLVPPGPGGPAAEALTATQATAAVAVAATDAPDPAVIARLESLMESVSEQPLYRGNEVDLLVDGPATYDAMLEAIAAAREHVHLESYIFNDDRVGRRFANALIGKRREGVEVRVIYDSLGSRSAEDDFFARMRDTGVELLEFNPVNPLDGGNPLDANVRNHRKMLIVDGRTAFTGGINIDRNYSSSSGLLRRRKSRQQGWRDTHIAITGPAVDGFQQLFLDHWTSGDALVPRPVRDYFGRAAVSGDSLVRVLSAVGGDEDPSPIRTAYVLALELAHERIWITQAYFAPDPEFLDLMKEAARRGVDVRIAVAGKSDSALLLALSRRFYGGLLEAGVRIFESEDTVLHAKTAVVDGVWSTVGSSNLDYRSFIHNHEVNAVIVGAEFGRELERLFEQDMEHSTEVTMAGWRDRPLAGRLLEWLAWTVRYWL